MDLFTHRHDPLRFTQVDPNQPALYSGNNTVDDSSNLIFVFIHYNFALGFAQTLQNNLLGSLSGNPTKVFDLLMHLHLLTNSSIFFDCLGVL